jgi:hypothetical protein
MQGTTKALNVSLWNTYWESDTAHGFNRHMKPGTSLPPQEVFSNAKRNLECQTSVFAETE